MKKLLSLGIIFLFSMSAFGIQHYQMEDTICPKGGVYSACREFPTQFCSVFEQTFCGEPPAIGD